MTDKSKVVFEIDGLELTDETTIAYDQSNPKRPGTGIYNEYEKFKKCRTVGELRKVREKFWRADIKFDFEHGYLKIDGKSVERAIGRKAMKALKEAAAK